MSHSNHPHNTATSPNDNAAGNMMVVPTPSKFSLTTATQQASKFSLSNYATNINSSSHSVGSGTNNPYRTSLGASNHHQQQQQQQQSSSTTMTHPSDGIENNKNNANTGSFSAAPTSSSSQDLESKLHNTAASFRKSRDEAHRHHTIAQERLRIAKEEYQNLQTSVQSLQQHLQSMHQMCANFQSKFQGLQTEVQQLSNEVRFQHAELISKRNQLQDQRTKGPLGPSASVERQAALNRLQQAVQSQRKKFQMMNRGSSSGAVPKILHGTVFVDYLKEHIPEGRTEIPIAVLRRWDRLLEQSVSKIKDQIHERSQRTNGELRKKLKFLEEKYEAFIAAHQGNDMTPTTTTTKKNGSASNHPSTDDHHRDTLMADVVPTNDTIMTETIRLDPLGQDDDVPPLVTVDVTDAPMMTTTTTDELIVVDESDTSNMSDPTVVTLGPTSGHTRVRDDQAVVTSEATVM